MRTIGKLTTAVLVAVLVVAAVAIWRSLPDIQRYLRIRQMSSLR